MHRWIKFTLLLCIAMFFSGCGGMGVYSSDFECPAAYNGRCVSLPGAYDLAKRGQDGAPHDPAVQDQSVKKDKDGKPVAATAVLPNGSEGAYKDSLYRRFDTLLKEPHTPMVAPPQVMRVLLLPYKSDDNELYMLRYVYFFVDGPKWVLGDSVVSNGEDEGD